MAIARAALLALALCVGTQPAQSQEMRSIAEVISIQPAQAFIRCAGLYSAIAWWAGADRLGQETMDTTEDAMRTNLANAVVAYQNSGIGATLDETIQIASRDTNSAYDLYIDRFSRNVAAVGEAFGQDPMVQSDLEVCTLLTERFAN